MNSELNIQTSDGYWSIRSSPVFSIDNLMTSLITENEWLRSIDAECETEILRNAIVFIFQNLTVTIKISDFNDDSITFDSIVTNHSSIEQRIQSIIPIQYCGDWNAEGPFTIHKETVVFAYPAERCYGYDGAHEISDNEPLMSCWFTSFHDPITMKNFIAGIYDIPQGFVRYNITPLQSSTEKKRVLQWSCEVDCHSGMRGVRLKPGETLRLGMQYLKLWDGEHQDGLQEYGELLGKKYRRKSLDKVPVGWCSWYAGYETNINEEECLKNLIAAQKIEKFEYFQIDDGWTINRGTQKYDLPEVDSDKFPHGMKWLADQIRSHGLKPGLWVRPFQGWSNGDDIPVWARGQCIDLSNRDARAWLKNIMKKIVQDWDYEYIKLDFMTYDFFQQWGMSLLHSSLAPFGPHDDSLTNIQMYRLGLEAIREGAGETCFLLGCNCLIGPAIGLINAQRIGDDVSANNWDRTFTMGVRSIAPMHFLNGSVWWNDPDCMMFQEPMNIDKVKMWASLIVLSGGMRIISSNLFELSSERREALRKILSLSIECSHPVDITNSNPPEMWFAKSRYREQEYFIIGLFNWNNEKKNYQIDLHRLGLARHYEAIDFWNDTLIGRVEKKYEAKIDPSQCKLICLKEVKD